MKESAYYQTPQNFVIFQPQSLYLFRLKQGYYVQLQYFSVQLLQFRLFSDRLQCSMSNQR